MIKRWIGQMAVIAMLVCWSLLYEDYGMMALAIICLVLPIVSFISIIYIRKRVSILLSTRKDKTSVNGKQDIIVTVNNKSIFPVICLKLTLCLTNEMYGVDDEKEMDIYTEKRGIVSRTFRFRASCAGCIRVRADKIYVYDFFKLFRLPLKAEKEAVFVVIPNLGMLTCEEVPENKAVVIDSDKFSKTQKGDDVSEVFDIRPYVEGDRLNTVNWKLSARMQEIIVKELSKPIGNGIVILVEMLTDSNAVFVESYVDAILSTAVSISLKLKELGYEHYIAWYDVREKMVQRYKVTESSELTDIVAPLLANCVYSDENHLAHNYYQEFMGENDAHIYYVTTRFTSAALDSIAYSQRCAIKKLIFIAASLDSVPEKAAEVAFANEMYMDVIALNNPRTLTGLEL